MAQDYNRLQRSDWDKLGAMALARELFSILNTATGTRPDPASDGFYVKANESGSDADGDYTIDLQAGGEGWDNGTVISGGGVTYQVRLSGGNTVSATVPRALATDDVTIPEDAQCIVIRLADNSYRLIAATWVTSSE